MRQRGDVYWDWVNPNLHFRNLDERLPCGALINIQARLSPDRKTQVFFGIYGERGVLLVEEQHLDCQGQTMTAAMVWALQRATRWVEQNAASRA